MLLDKFIFLIFIQVDQYDKKKINTIPTVAAMKCHHAELTTIKIPAKPNTNSTYIDVIMKVNGMDNSNPMTKTGI